MYIWTDGTVLKNIFVIKIKHDEVFFGRGNEYSIGRGSDGQSEPYGN